MDAARFSLGQGNSLQQDPQRKPRGVSFDSEKTFLGESSPRITAIHTKARLPNYPGNSIVRRFKVPDDKVLWEVSI